MAKHKGGIDLSADMSFICRFVDSVVSRQLGSDSSRPISFNPFGFRLPLKSLHLPSSCSTSSSSESEIDTCELEISCPFEIARRVVVEPLSFPPTPANAMEWPEQLEQLPFSSSSSSCLESETEEWPVRFNVYPLSTESNRSMNTRLSEKIMGETTRIQKDDENHPKFIPNLRQRVLSRARRESKDMRGHMAGEGEEGEEEEEESSTLPTAVSRSTGGGRYANVENDEIDGTDAGSDRESEEEAPPESTRAFVRDPPALDPPANRDPFLSINENAFKLRGFFLLYTERRGDPSVTTEELLTDISDFLFHDVTVDALVHQLAMVRCKLFDKIIVLEFLSRVLMDKLENWVILSSSKLLIFFRCLFCRFFWKIARGYRSRAIYPYQIRITVGGSLLCLDFYELPRAYCLEERDAFLKNMDMQW